MPKKYKSAMPGKTSNPQRPQRPSSPKNPLPPNKKKFSKPTSAPRGAAHAPQKETPPPRGHAPREFHGGKGSGKQHEIKKQIWGAATLLSPVPAVMVSCATKEGRPNIITIAWAGTICSDPPLLSISIRPERNSYAIINESREFVVNVPSEKELPALDYCGVASGRDVNKFEKTGLTAAPASKVSAPIIAECPLNIECRVRRVIELGTHAMFIAEIVAVQVSADLVNPVGRLALEKAGLVAFAHGEYYALGRKLGHFGYSVKRHKKKR